MAKRDTIIAAMDKYLKISDFRDYAPMGLQVEGAETVKKIVTGVSLCKALLEAAVSVEAQMVIVHHGMFWKDQSPVLKGAQKERVAYLLENDLTLISYHLPLDAHGEIGNNAQILKLIKGGRKRPFGDYHGTKIGFMGSFERAQTMAAIKKRLSLLTPEEEMYCPHLPSKIKHIGVVSGGAGSLFEQAIEEDLDLFITGEAWEPAQALAEETGVGFLSMGHYNSEKLGVIALGGWLKRRFKVKVEFIDVPNRA